MECGWSSGTLPSLFLHNPFSLPILSLFVEKSLLSSLLSMLCFIFLHQQLHQQVEKCLILVVPISLRQWNAMPHIFKVSVLNSVWTESCFSVDGQVVVGVVVGVEQGLFIVTQHTAMLNQQSHMMKDYKDMAHWHRAGLMCTSTNAKSRKYSAQRVCKSFELLSISILHGVLKK